MIPGATLDVSEGNFQKPREAAADYLSWGQQPLLDNAYYFFSFQACCKYISWENLSQKLWRKGFITSFVIFFCDAEENVGRAGMMSRWRHVIWHTIPSLKIVLWECGRLCFLKMTTIISPITYTLLIKWLNTPRIKKQGLYFLLASRGACDCNESYYVTSEAGS